MYFYIKIYFLIVFIYFCSSTRIHKTLFYNVSEEEKNEYIYYKKNLFSTLKNHAIPYIPFNDLFLKNKSKLIKSNHINLFPKESWYYMNGITTDINLSYMTAQHIESIFNRPCNIMYNETRSCFIDTLEACLQLLFPINTRIIKEFAKNIITEISNNKRVIIICHSEGTIICKNLVKYLFKNYPDLNFKKIELYCFANYALFNFPKLDNKSDNKPYIELLVNKNDIFPYKISNNKYQKVDKIDIKNEGNHWINYDYLRNVTNFKNSKLNSYFIDNIE